MGLYCDILGDTGVRVSKEGGRYDCPVCHLWLSEERPGLDPQFKEGVNPKVCDAGV